MPPLALGEETAKFHAVTARVPVFLSSTAGGLPATSRADIGGSTAASADTIDSIDTIHRANETRRLIALISSLDSRFAPNGRLATSAARRDRRRAAESLPPTSSRAAC